MAEETENNKITLNLDFEPIIPWNGQQDTGRDVRLKLDRNWQKVADAFNALLDGLFDLNTLDKRYLRKDIPDSTKFLIQFLAGLEAGLYADGGTDGSKLHSDGLAELGRLQVNGDSEFRGNLSSQDFISGFMTGRGWAMQLKKYINAAGVEETKAVGELDDLIVRGTLRVFEFVVSQLLGENDNRVFTAMLEVDHYDPATGKVWLDTQNGKLYNPFRIDDCIVVQQYNGMPSEDNGYYITKQYELVITGVGVGDISLGEDRLDWVTFKNFTTTMEGGDLSLIAKGDTFVRWDNLSDPNRKGIIQMMTVGESTPYMDVAYGLKTDPDNAHKGRFGNLEGIYNRLFGWLKDFGAYLINFYGVGDFRFAHSGEDASDKIEMVQGAFRTNFKQSYFDLTDEDNFLTNGSFSGELEGWVTGDSATDFLTIGGLAIYANRSLMVDSPCFVGKAIYNDKDMLRIHNSDIRQPNSYVRQPGTHKEYVPMDGSEDEPSYDYVEVPDKMFLGIRFHCVREGELEFGFANNDVSAEALPYTVMHVSKSVEAQSVEVSGIWNGKGDFVIKTTGDIYIDWLVLSDKPLDNLKTTTRTWIEQDAGRIALLGQKIVKNGQIITDLGIELDAVNEQINLYIDKANAIEGSVLNLGIRLDGVDESISIYAAKTDANTASISALQVEVDSINLTVVEVQGDLDTARAIAEAAAEAADQAQDTADDGLYKATSNASVIQMHTDSISILNGRFAADGSLVNTSGLVTTSEYNSLYSAHYDLAGEVATKADVSTSVQYDPTSGDIISNVKITADVVDINNGVVQIDSDSATIGGFKVRDTEMTAGSLSNGAMTLSQRVLGFRQTNGLHVLIGPDAAPDASGSEVGLYSEAPKGDFSIWALGGSRLVARYSNELTMIGGLALTCKTGNTLSGANNASNVSAQSWVDFLVTNGDVTLPSPKDCPGKVLMFHCTGSRKFSSSDGIYTGNNHSLVYSETFDKRSVFYINDGTYWYSFYCYYKD